jgi:hypothetical protein
MSLKIKKQYSLGLILKLEEKKVLLSLLTILLDKVKFMKVIISNFK